MEEWTRKAGLTGRMESGFAKTIQEMRRYEEGRRKYKQVLETCKKFRILPSPQFFESDYEQGGSAWEQKEQVIQDITDAENK